MYKFHNAVPFDNNIFLLATVFAYDIKLKCRKNQDKLNINREGAKTSHSATASVFRYMLVPEEGKASFNSVLSPILLEGTKL